VELEPHLGRDASGHDCRGQSLLSVVELSANPLGYLAHGVRPCRMPDIPSGGIGQLCRVAFNRLLLFGFTFGQWVILVTAVAAGYGGVKLLHIPGQVAVSTGVFVIGLPAALVHLSDGGQLGLGRLVRDAVAWMCSTRLLEAGEQSSSQRLRCVRVEEPVDGLERQVDLSEWRLALRRCGHPARDVDFIIPGDLGGAQHGISELRTSACHFTQSQAKSWRAKFFKPAVNKVAERPEFAHILGATPYALRRGGISLRLRAEDPQTVASECGTSLQVLSAHYAFAIEDLRRSGPRPVDIEWRAARTAQAERQSQEQARRAATTEQTAQRRWKFFARFARRRTSPAS
jgi:hypothetical protein